MGIPLLEEGGQALLCLWTGAQVGEPLRQIGQRQRGRRIADQAFRRGHRVRPRTEQLGAGRRDRLVERLGGDDLVDEPQAVRLRRVEAAGAGLDRAISLSELQGEGGKDKAEQALIPMDQMLDTLPSVELNAQGLSQVRFGRDLGEPDTSSGFAEAVQAASGPAREHARLLDPSGHLVAIAEAAAPGLLHPSVVLM